MTGAAAFEENAELQELRSRADQTGREAAQTLAELAGRLADARDPKVVARRTAARGRNVMARAQQRVPAGLAGPPEAKRAALAMVPALSLLALAIISRRRGWQLPYYSRRLTPLPPGRASPRAVPECVRAALQAKHHHRGGGLLPCGGGGGRCPAPRLAPSQAGPRRVIAGGGQRS